MNVANLRPITQVYGVAPELTTSGRIAALKGQLLGSSGQSGSLFHLREPNTKVWPEAEGQPVPAPVIDPGVHEKRSSRPKSRLTRETKSVWTKYEKDYDIRFGEAWMTVASSFSGTPAMILQREHPAHETDSWMWLLSILDDRAEFLTCFAVFDELHGSALAMEPMHRSLLQLTTAPRQPTEDELRACIAQIANGVQFLHCKAIMHGSIRLDTIMVDVQGRVQLLPPISFRCSVDDDSCLQKDVHALGLLTAELMAKRETFGEQAYSTSILDLISMTTTENIDAVIKVGKALQMPAGC